MGRCRFAIFSVVVACCWLSSSGCSPPDEPFPNDDELSAILTLQSIHTPPRDSTNTWSDSVAAAELGSMLFSEPSLSSCGRIACGTCHPPPNFTQNMRFGVGCGGSTPRNITSVLNTAFLDWYYWDGRKDSLWAHPMTPLLDPIEMGSSPALVRMRLSEGYAAAYQALFGKAPADETDDNRLLANFGKTIEAYLRRSLVQVDAPFDAKLAHFIASAQAGNATTDPFYESLRVFVRKGNCVFCHKGPLLSDGSFHNIGVRQETPTDKGHLDGLRLLNKDPWNGNSIYTDDATSAHTKLSTLDALSNSDLEGAFKTPMLRNVPRTAPYMHTGEYATLEDVIEFYNRGGDPEGTFPGVRALTVHPLALTPSEKSALLELLQSLALDR